MASTQHKTGDTTVMFMFGPTSILTMKNHTCTRFKGADCKTSKDGEVIPWETFDSITVTPEFQPLQSGFDEASGSISLVFCSKTHAYRFTCPWANFVMYDGMVPITTRKEVAGTEAITTGLATFFQTRYSPLNGVQFALTDQDLQSMLFSQ